MSTCQHKTKQPHRNNLALTISAWLFGQDLRWQLGQHPANPTTPIGGKYDDKKVRNTCDLKLLRFLVWDSLGRKRTQKSQSSIRSQYQILTATLRFCRSSD